jgi:hypothetical protein
VAEVGPITGARLACDYSLRRAFVWVLLLTLPLSARRELGEVRAVGPSAGRYKAGRGIRGYLTRCRKRTGRCDMRSFVID